MAHLSIRAASAADVESVTRLLEAQLHEHEIFAAREALRKVAQAVVDHSGHGFILLAWSGDQAVGVAYAAAHLSAEHGGVVGWLEELYVAPECRAQGIGGELLRVVMSEAQRLGWRAMELEVVAGHERAAALYLRHGFALVNRTRYTRLLA